MINPSTRRIRQHLDRQAQESLGQFKVLAGEMRAAFQSLASGRPPWIEELTLADVVAFFVEHRQLVPAAEAAAILREPAERESESESPAEEYLVHLFFLDQNGRPIAGSRQAARTYLTRRFDAELIDAFGSNNVVIFN